MVERTPPWLERNKAFVQTRLMQLYEQRAPIDEAIAAFEDLKTKLDRGEHGELPIHG